MCRLFGFRSVIQSHVHSSLVSADNALVQQSQEHPDGWGVAYYQGGAPHVVKSASAAIEDALFQRVSGVVSSETVVAHLRKATLGQLCITNSHPFQFGKWVFAHNGNIKNFDRYRKDLVLRVDLELQRFILGETDSELIFYLILSRLKGSVDLHGDDVAIEDLRRACESAVNDIVDIVGPFHPNDDGDPGETYLTFILTNGRTMIAHQGGKSLLYSTYKKRCPDRDSCSSFAPECEAPTESGDVNHLIFSSESLAGENIWIPLQPGDYVGVDCEMRLYLASRSST